MFCSASSVPSCLPLVGVTLRSCQIHGRHWFFVTHSFTRVSRTIRVLVSFFLGGWSQSIRVFASFGGFSSFFVFFHSCHPVPRHTRLHSEAPSRPKAYSSSVFSAPKHTHLQFSQSQSIRVFVFSPVPRHTPLHLFRRVFVFFREDSFFFRVWSSIVHVVSS